MTSQDLKIFETVDLESLDRSRIPKHIAIIPDGNRRWAKGQQYTSEEGHREGADVLMDIVKAGKELGIEILTFYIFSTENWARPQAEIIALMLLLRTYLMNQRQFMKDNGVQFQTIGNLSRLPKAVVDEINKSKEETSQCQDIKLIFALNYGGRDEICRAVQTMFDDYDSKKINKEDITEALVSRYLDTANLGDPEP